MWMLVLFASWHDLSPLPRRWAVLLGVWPCLSVGCGCCPLRSFLVLPGRLPSLSRPEQCLRRRRGMRDGRAARADAERAGRDAARITAPQISRTCPAAPYGVYSAAPGSGKTIALTFDDGPARPPDRSCRFWRRTGDGHVLQHWREHGGVAVACPQRGPRRVHARQPHLGPPGHDDLVGVGAGRRDGPGQRRAAQHHRHLAVRVPAAVRQLHLHHRKPGAATVDEVLDVVGGHRGLEGRRLVVLLLGQEDHLAGRERRPWPTAPGRAHAQRALRRPGHRAGPADHSSSTSVTGATPSLTWLATSASSRGAPGRLPSPRRRPAGSSMCCTRRLTRRWVISGTTRGTAGGRRLRWAVRWRAVSRR